MQKRKRREYRQQRKAAFTRPEPGFSLYEGRTRGKRIKYTYSSDEEEGSETTGARRSTRQSGISTPAETTGPTFTASGRQVRSRHVGAYGESALSSTHTAINDAGHTEDANEGANIVTLRTRRSGA